MSAVDESTAGAMRFCGPGAAGLIGSHLVEALTRPGHNVIGVDSFTDYYELAFKEDARSLTVRRLDLVREDLDLRESTACSTLPANPGVRSFSRARAVYNIGAAPRNDASSDRASRNDLGAVARPRPLAGGKRRRAPDRAVHVTGRARRGWQATPLEDGIGEWGAAR
jgi:NAD dependent epimerase/dehydratase family